MTRQAATGVGIVKRIVFSLLPLAVLLLLLAGAEIMLRLTSGPATEEPAREARFDGVEWFETNRGLLRKYFPVNSPMVPEVKTTLFRKVKRPETFRVMCLGGSTMFGTPYDMSANIQGILRKQLRHRHPERELEVVNWGASAINSNVVRDMLPRLLRYAPDLVIVYMGHNEFYGPDGVGASWPEKVFPSLIRLKYSMRDLRIIQVLLSWFAVDPASPGGTPNLMRQVSEGSRVRLDSDDTEYVVSLFRENLSVIVEQLRKAGIPLVLSEVSSNLMFPPFLTDSLAGGRSPSRFGREMKALAAGSRYAEMLNETDRLPIADSLHPLALYWRGIAERGLGRLAEAKHHLTLARDHDLLKFRAPGMINDVIRSVCAAYDVPLVRADSLMAAAAPDGIPGDSLFWEHLHPTPEGYYVLAAGFAAAIEELDIVGPPAQNIPLLPMDPDRLSLCWLDLAYGDYSIQRLTGKWPFEDYRRVPRVLGEATPDLVRIVEDTYRRTLQWNEACYASATLFWRTGRLRDALTTYEAMLEEYPYGFYTNYLAGNLLSTMGEHTRALGYLRVSIRSNPSYAPARLDAGLLEVNAGRIGAGLKELQEVLRLTGPSPADRQIRANAHYGIAAAHANTGNLTQALREIDKALALVPEYADAIRLREEVARSRTEE